MKQKDYESAAYYYSQSDRSLHSGIVIVIPVYVLQYIHLHETEKQTLMKLT